MLNTKVSILYLSLLPQVEVIIVSDALHCHHCNGERRKDWVIYIEYVITEGPGNYMHLLLVHKLFRVELILACMGLVVITQLHNELRQKSQKLQQDLSHRSICCVTEKAFVDPPLSAKISN